MRIFCASLVHESHSFSPIPTNLASYREGFLYRPSTGEGADIIEQVSPEGNLRLRVRAAGHELVDGLHAAAAPSAPTVRGAYEALRDELMENLSDAAPVDAVLLFLHGAQLAEGYSDCEGDILSRVRTIVGPSVPIGVALDLHANLTQQMVDNATVLMACKEYPHTDFSERAGELLDLIERTARREIKPVMALRRVPMFGFFHTTREPMRGFVDEIMAREGRDGVLSISIAHGFGYSDTKHAGASVLVVTDGDSARAGELAEHLADRLFAMREEIAAPVLPLSDALNEALAYPGFPVVIADTSDNPGGGAAGDSTIVLRALLDRDVRDAALGMMWDPGAVHVAERAGVGARIALRLGGKVGPGSGDPLDVEAEVFALSHNAKQTAFGAPSPLGPAAALQIGGISVVVNSLREQVHDAACFSELGIDPRSKRLLVVKSAQHFHASFAPFAARILYAEGPGTVATDFSSLPFQNITRPQWPLDAPPFLAFGKTWHA